nr:ribonuclease H-like domain-containing protein [Tanacetum cinerariifolium]
HDFASCVLSPTTTDSFSTVDVKILPKSSVTDPSPLNGVSSCSIKENVKSPSDLCNKRRIAASVPAGSRNSSASTTADRFIPAASRNRSTSIHAGRSIPPISRNRSASIHAGRSILAASRNKLASIHAGRFIPAASRNRPASIHASRHIPAGRSNKPAPFSAGQTVPTGWINHAARSFFGPKNLYFDNVVLGEITDLTCNGVPRTMVDLINLYGFALNDLQGRLKDYSNARTPQQNRVAERKNRTLIEAARSMLADSKLPTMFWTEAVSTACYVLNRVSITNPHNKTPYELLSGKIPNI